MISTFLTQHRERIVGMLYQRIQQTMPADHPFAPLSLQEHLAKGAAAFLETLQANTLEPLDRFLDEMLAPRTVEDFPLATLHRAFTVFGEMLLPLLHECYGPDLERILEDLQRLHLLINTVLQKLVEHYETSSKALVRRQQEQLEHYSHQLEAQLIQVGEEFQTLQEFNESILQSMSSGLLVTDKHSHRILKVNRAMERLSGLEASAMLGKTVEEVFANRYGCPPIEAFAEEVERQGRITLQKHRLVAADGTEYYRSIHGQVFYNKAGKNTGVIVLVDDISEAEILRETFSRYLSAQVMDEVLSGADFRSLRNARRDVSVLFADIRNFTTFAERHQPEQVVDVLNEYFEALVQVLFEHQGTLDKFLGDGLLALFGTPLAQPDHSARAVQAALAMQRAVIRLNSARQRRGQPTLQMGIGLNTGAAIVGNIGSERRMEYTVVGDMVNVAQRLQALASGGEILIGTSMLPSVRHLINIYDTVETQVKGRQQPVRAHRIGSREA
ncbi:MAG: adenylate/guanylate cyclase domain-containing protein [Candidatus Tectimicrobiota bacterium]